MAAGRPRSGIPRSDAVKEPWWKGAHEWSGPTTACSRCGEVMSRTPGVPRDGDLCGKCRAETNAP